NAICAVRRSIGSGVAGVVCIRKSSSRLLGTLALDHLSGHPTPIILQRSDLEKMSSEDELEEHFLVNQEKLLSRPFDGLWCSVLPWILGWVIVFVLLVAGLDKRFCMVFAPLYNLLENWFTDLYERQSISNHHLSANSSYLVDRDWLSSSIILKELSD